MEGQASSRWKAGERRVSPGSCMTFIRCAPRRRHRPESLSRGDPIALRRRSLLIQRPAMLCSTDQGFLHFGDHRDAKALPDIALPNGPWQREIQRPHNFFDYALIEQIANAFEALDDTPSCRAIILAAQGKNAGANFGSGKADDGNDEFSAEGFQ